MKYDKELDDPFTNLLIIIAGMGISYGFSLTADTDKAELGGLVYVFMPGILTALTAIIYFFSRTLTKSNNWIFTLMGVSFNIIFSIDLHWNLLSWNI